MSETKVVSVSMEPWQWDQVCGAIESCCALHKNLAAKGEWTKVIRDLQRNLETIKASVGD